MCPSTRYVLIGGVAGVIAASLSGSEIVGWIVAGLTVTAAWLVGRRFPGRFGAASCALPTAPSSRHDDAGETGAPAPIDQYRFAAPADHIHDINHASRH